MGELFATLMKTALLRTMPRLLFKLQHYKLHKQFGTHAYWANLKTPKTFNEHVLATKLDSSLKHIGPKVVDKAHAKNYVANVVGPEYVIPTLGIFDRLDDLVHADLSTPYVIKPTHLSGQIIFKTHQDGALTHSEKTRISDWLCTNHYLRTGEPQYKDLCSRIIAEPYMGTEYRPPDDYKFFCWRGEPKLIQVDTSRFHQHRRNFFDTEWNSLDMQLRYPRRPETITAPAVLPEMLQITRRLSAPFPFVRVDLYEYNRKVLFGEMTFHPDSGNAPFGRFADDLALGRYFQ